MSAATFDPYRNWLGIYPEEQPASLYRLLGVREFEADPTVIDAGYVRRMSYLHGIKSGKHVDAAERLKAELADAKMRLLNPAKKQAYDEGRRRAQAQATAERDAALRAELRQAAEARMRPEFAGRLARSLADAEKSRTAERMVRRAALHQELRAATVKRLGAERAEITESICRRKEERKAAREAVFLAEAVAGEKPVLLEAAHGSRSSRRVPSTGPLAARSRDTESKDLAARQAKIIRSWREQIYYVPPEAFQASSVPRPFQFDEKPPVAPDLEGLRRDAAVRARDEFRRNHPVPLTLRLCIATVVAVPSALIGLLAGQTTLALMLLVVVLWVGNAALSRWWIEEYAGELQARIAAIVAQEGSVRLQAYGEELADYRRRRSAAKHEWNTSERNCTRWARRLVAGKPKAMRDALEVALGNIVLPFSIRHRFSLLPPKVAQIAVELPLPSEVLVRPAWVSAREPHDYSQLAAGIVLLFAATALSAAPSLSTVVAGAYRRRPGLLEDEDGFGILVRLERARLEAVDLPRCDPVDLFLSLGGELALFDERGDFRPLPAPDWNAPVETRTAVPAAQSALSMRADA